MQTAQAAAVATFSRLGLWPCPAESRTCEDHSASGSIGKLPGILAALRSNATYPSPITQCPMQEIQIASRRQTLRFCDQPLGLASAGRRLPFRSAIAGETGKDQFVRDLPNCRCRGGGVLRHVEDRQQQRQSVPDVIGRAKRVADRGPRLTAAVCTEGAQGREPQRNSVIGADDIVDRPGRWSDDETVATASIAQDKMASGLTLGRGEHRSSPNGRAELDAFHDWSRQDDDGRIYVGAPQGRPDIGSVRRIGQEIQGPRSAPVASRQRSAPFRRPNCANARNRIDSPGCAAGIPARNRRNRTGRSGLPSRTCGSWSPPFTNRATGMTRSATFPDFGSPVPTTGDGRFASVADRSPPVRAPCSLHGQPGLGTTEPRDRIAGTGRVDNSARHQTRRSAQGPAAAPVKGRCGIPNDGNNLDTAQGSH